MGCEASKIPAEGDVFFLDFYLYRTYQALNAVPIGRGSLPIFSWRLTTALFLNLNLTPVVDHVGIRPIEPSFMRTLHGDTLKGTTSSGTSLRPETPLLEDRL
jgi:hypothetical protein